MSDRIGVMHEGILEQLGTPNEVYYQPQTSYVADFVGNANILRLGGETFAIRSENILMNGETVCTREAVVVEKRLCRRAATHFVPSAGRTDSDRQPLRNRQ